jgi:hypothetical protein
VRDHFNYHHASKSRYSVVTPMDYALSFINE